MITVDFSEIIAASDLKVSRSRYLIENMKICCFLVVFFGFFFSSFSEG